MTVLRTDEQRALALCADSEGVSRTVETALVGPLAAGAVVLVHAGVAIASLGVGGHSNAGPPDVVPSAQETA